MVEAKITGRQRGDINSSQMLERDIFKKCLEILLNKAKADEIDYGEKESILDALKTNLQFCIQHEEMLKQLGVEVPKHKASRNQGQRMSQIQNQEGGAQSEMDANGQPIAGHNSGTSNATGQQQFNSFLNQTNSEVQGDKNNMYSLNALMRAFKKFISESVDVYPIYTLPEDFTSMPRKEMANWKLDKVRIILQQFNEPMLNLHFFNPFLKSNSALHAYRLILTIFDYSTEEDNNRFIGKVIEYLQEYKKKLYESMEDDIETIHKVLPMFLIIKYAVSYLPFSDKDRLKQLAQECHELRMLPMPYGLLPHQVIEIIDQERIIPGLTRIEKLIEDFPYVDHHSINKEKDDIEIFHQRAFVYNDNYQEQSNGLLRIFNNLPSKIKMHVILNIFLASYNFCQRIGGIASSLEEHLISLQTSYVWNVFKQLLQDIDEKAIEMPYNELERNFRRLIMEPQADFILNKTIMKKGLINKRLKYFPKFKLIFDNTSSQSIQQFIQKQQEDKSYMPPIRLIVVGDDLCFHSFLQQLIREYISKNSNFYKHDVRVFIIPHQVNTLAQYLAIHDDIYCNNIFLKITQSPILSATKRQISVDQHIQTLSQSQLSSEEYSRLFLLNDQILQDFLRDAIFKTNVKVFVCDFFREPTDDKPYKQVFFTNRLEYGHSSVYRKLEAIHTTLQASNQSQLNEAEKKLEMVVQASENEGSLLFDNFDQSVRVTLQVKRMDYNGKEYVTDGSLEPYECTLAYLKLINVPTMFDIGCTQSDPSTDFLTLNMIDDKTFKIENQDFLNSNQKLKKTKVKKQRGALQAIHTNLFVSEVTIIPHAIVKDSAPGSNNNSKNLDKQDGNKRSKSKSQTRSGQDSGNPQQQLYGYEDSGIKVSSVPLIIDGNQIKEKDAKKFVIKRYKKDNIHVSVPIMSYLPLRSDDLINQNL
eukprot:403334151